MRYVGILERFNDAGASIVSPAPTPTPPPVTPPDTSNDNTTDEGNSNFIMPVVGGELRNDYPFYDDEGQYPHRGTNIGVQEYTPVLASMSGVVSLVDTTVNYNTAKLNDGSYGIHVKIVLYTGETVIYAHLSSVCVSVGQKVSTGDVIAYSGNTGNSTGPHLHYEVNDRYGNALDPRNYLPR